MTTPVEARDFRMDRERMSGTSPRGSSPVAAFAEHERSVPKPEFGSEKRTGFRLSRATKPVIEAKAFLPLGDVVAN